MHKNGGFGTCTIDLTLSVFNYTGGFLSAGSCPVTGSIIVCEGSWSSDSAQQYQKTEAANLGSRL